MGLWSLFIHSCFLFREDEHLKIIFATNTMFTNKSFWLITLKYKEWRYINRWWEFKNISVPSNYCIIDFCLFTFTNKNHGSLLSCRWEFGIHYIVLFAGSCLSSSMICLEENSNELAFPGYMKTLIREKQIRSMLSNWQELKVELKKIM